MKDHLVQIKLVSCCAILLLVICGSKTENVTVTTTESEIGINDRSIKDDNSVQRISMEEKDDAEDYTEANDSRNKTILANEESFRVLLGASSEFASLNDLSEDLEHWEASEYVRKNYPYYLSGHDDEGRPIWIGELGKWNVRKMVEDGEESLQQFNKYLRQSLFRALKSLGPKVSADDAFPELIYIADFDEFSFYQLTSAKSVAYFLKMLRDFEPLFRMHTFAGFFINANYVTETLIGLMRPILGGVFEKIQVFGTNRAKWMPHLVRILPRESIPPWYGGNKDFKAVAIYG